MPTTARLACLILIFCAGAAHAEVPPRTYAGQTLAVPDADFERGQIFYILPGEDTQITVTSTTSLKRTVLTTSRAVGFIVADFDPEVSKQPVLGAALRLPVAAIASASSATDRQLPAEDYLDAAAHPEMTFELTGTEKIEKLPSDDDDILPLRMKLRGKLTFRGVTHDVEMPAEVRFLLTNFGTFARAVGDLITIQGSFELEPADFGWKMPDSAAGLVAPSLAVDVFLLGSTTSPEKNLDPAVDLERWLAEQRYLTLARDLGDAEAAAAHGREILGKHRDDAPALASLARLILDQPGLPKRDLALARQLLERAQKLDAEGLEITETLEKLAAARGD